MTRCRAEIARGALEFAKANNRNTLIFDTAGRLQIDEPLVQELVRLLVRKRIGRRIDKQGGVLGTGV